MLLKGSVDLEILQHGCACVSTSLLLLGKLSKSPENKAKWAEMRKSQAAEHH
jgi:hypothetical protein